ncbi:MAG TPA: S41 family peptidase, partial [Chitinophagaceae bacterium]
MKRFFKNKTTGILTGIILLAGVIAISYRPVDKYFEIAKNLSIFAAVYRDLDAYYVDSITPAKLMGTAIDAMTESLDPYTTYYSENDLSDLKFITTGKYAGVGASIRKTGEWTAITDIYAHSPFQQAGIKIGDVIVSLNGQSAKNMSTEDISKLLKGDPGSVLNLIVRNPVNGRESAKKVTRAEISVNSVSYAGMVPGTRNGIGYIKMVQFTEFSADEVRAAFDSLQHAHPRMKGIILDLRGNPGGLLDEAVRTANIFMDPGLSIVSTRGKITGWNRDYKTVSAADNDSIPLA